MEKEKVMRISAIIVGLLISIVLLWFGFRLVQNRFSQASTTVVGDECVQDDDSVSSYTATFDLGKTSDTVDVVWGIDPDTLTSRAEPDCTGPSCEVQFDLVPADSTPYYLVLVGGVRVGRSGTTGDGARPFECQAADAPVADEPNPTSAPAATTAPVASPTGPVAVCPTIRALFPVWNKQTIHRCFAAGYTAADCACMNRDASSTDGN